MTNATWLERVNLTVRLLSRALVHNNETGGSNDTTLMGRPSEIWVDPADNEVFVADGYGNRRIIVFDGATGRPRAASPRVGQAAVSDRAPTVGHQW